MVAPHSPLWFDRSRLDGAAVRTMPTAVVAERAQRPCTTSFEPVALADAWWPSAQLKRPGRAWDGWSYKTPSRALVGDPQSLAAHAVPLKELLKLAPSGFPCHSQLRETRMLIHSQFGLFAENELLLKTATEATDRWMIMCRHLDDLKKVGAVHQC